MPFIETKDATSLFYRDWGEGKPVVFCAGWTLSSDMWRSQMLALSDAGLRCIAYDRRGHGRSDDPGNGYDYDTLADDLAASGHRPRSRRRASRRPLDGGRRGHPLPGSPR